MSRFERLRYKSAQLWPTKHYKLTNRLSIKKLFFEVQYYRISQSSSAGRTTKIKRLFLIIIKMCDQLHQTYISLNIFCVLLECGVMKDYEREANWVDLEFKRLLMLMSLQEWTRLIEVENSVSDNKTRRNCEIFSGLGCANLVQVCFSFRRYSFRDFNCAR